jgi:predicted TIM-barrel fold metal-dependent hydrolase
MIDTHLHVVPPQLPGVGPLSGLLDRPPEEVATALRREMKAADVQAALAMGRLNGPPDDPLGVGETLAVARSVPGLHAVGVADPRRTDPDHLRRVDEQLAGGAVKALKAYLGYLHYGPEHAGYRPYYELAERHNIPFVFHTGDTFSPYAKLKYAHPLGVDEAAVDHPQVRFVLAHVGNPWLLEAAEVVYKNLNVWADVSGLAVGGEADFSAPQRQETLQEAREGLRRAFRYAERPNRFLYGSDWPLAPLAAYKAFIAAAVPEIYHSQLFEETARSFFRI